MINMKNATWMMVGLALLITLGCSSSTDIESDLGIEDAPDWVNEGSQAVSNKRGRLIQGVGSAPRLGDASLQKATADNRARAEVARIMASYMDIVMEDYSASSAGSDPHRRSRLGCDRAGHRRDSSDTRPRETALAAPDSIGGGGSRPHAHQA